MNGKGGRFFYVVLVIGLIVCIWQNVMLSGEILNMERAVSRHLSQVEQNVNRIYGDVHNMMEEEGSILTGNMEYEFRDGDFSEGKVKLYVSLTPKAYVEHKTKGSLICNREEVVLEEEKGSFVGIIDLPMFGESVIERVMFREGSQVRTEKINLHLVPHREYLPEIYTDFSYSMTGQTDEEGIYKLRVTGDVTAEFYARSKQAGLGLCAVDLVEYINGVEVSRKAMRLDGIGEDGLQSPILEKSATTGDSSENAGNRVHEFYAYQVDTTYEIPFDSIWSLLVEAKDENGLVYQAILVQRKIDAQGRDVSGDDWRMHGDYYVYNQNGELLYAPVNR